jgi:hypothetical protein
MSGQRGHWVWILIALSLLLNVAAIGGVVALASSPSAANWIAPKLHLATNSMAENARWTAEEAQSTAEEAQSTLSSLCDEFGNYSGAFKDIYFAACYP